MPNFAQECPFLIFLPVIILSMAGTAAGIVHLMVSRHSTARPRQVARPALQASGPVARRSRFGVAQLGQNTGDHGDILPEPGLYPATSLR